jgi:peroxiredoxin
LCDETRTVSQIYGAANAADTQYPARISYLIDDQGRIEKVYAEVDPAAHPDQVLRDIGG